MKKIHPAVKTFVCFIIFFSLQAFSHPWGGDYYKILLNKQLITEQYLTKPVAMKTLVLNNSNNSDELTVYYSHCGTAGTDRMIALKSESGKILKAWKFSDTKSTGMQLAVKAILDASVKNNQVLMYYSSKEMPSGKQLLTIRPGSNFTVKL